jgi:hypothetical protein
VCYRRCRALGEDSHGPWCNDAACCEKACAAFAEIVTRGGTVGWRQCQDEREARTQNPP